MSEDVGNLVKPRGHSADALFHSSAFIAGFRDKWRGDDFAYPSGARGPNPGRRSAEIAYERGRAFAILWGARSIANRTAMIATLKQAHKQGIIL